MASSHAPRPLLRHGLLLVASLAAAACTWETDLPDSMRAVEVDATRELVITDGRTLASDAFSFGHALERLALLEGASLAWLEAWSRRLVEEGGHERARRFDEAVTCRWLRTRAENR